MAACAALLQGLPRGLMAAVCVPFTCPQHALYFTLQLLPRYSKMVPTNLVPSINLMPPGQRGGADWAQAQEAEPMVVWESK